MKRRLCIAGLVALPGLACVPAAAQVDGKLLDMLDQLDQIERQEFQAAIDQADACTRARDFACTSSQLAKAAKFASGARNQSALTAAGQRLAAEKKLAEGEALRKAGER